MAAVCMCHTFECNGENTECGNNYIVHGERGEKDKATARETVEQNCQLTTRQEKQPDRKEQAQQAQMWNRYMYREACKEQNPRYDVTMNTWVEAGY